MADPRVLVARVGWMAYYDGQRDDDAKPIGGGKYNDENIGHEVLNFRKDDDDRCYGYAQPSGGQGNIIEIRRIDPDAKGDSLEGVTVIFVAKKPTGGPAGCGLVQGCYCPSGTTQSRNCRQFLVFLRNQQS